MKVLTCEHINACNEFMDEFTNNGGIRWAILFAQMQSGKTFAFLLTACEMYRQGLIKYIVIFSGCAEKILKTQLQNIIDGKNNEFYRAYKIYLRNKHCFEHDDAIEDFIDCIKTKINIVWGASELKKSSKKFKPNTLYIWEESHYAQSIDNKPSSFLNTIGIAGNGDKLTLEANNNYLISVSATPFSELYDNLKYPNKKIVYLRPGVGYNSVKKMLAEQRIQFYDNLCDGLRKALNTHTDSNPKYAIIRVGKKADDIQKILDENGWRVVHYDCEDETNRILVAEDIIENMDNIPEQNIAILVKGFFRMGANIEKKHVSFMLEVADSSNTDTLLQSLLGRACGYSEGSD